MPYCIYLRKSRADAEAEAHGEGETLARHERALLDLARRQSLNITAIYREIVSGETIAARPVMQHLLSEVEDGLWEGVLVMEVERLARGDTIDQGLVSRAFTYSDTRIITPSKTYDPKNEFDTEYFEFGLFMSRREYQTINRRLQRGRDASVKEGKYVGNIAPYGYQRVKLVGEKGWTLEPDPDEAPTVKLIYEWYTVGAEQEDGSRERIGCAKIAHRLNQMGLHPRKSNEWVLPAIRDILRNPIYAGIITWGRRPHKKRVTDGQVALSRPRTAEYTQARGRHLPLITQETFDLAQHYLSLNPPRPVGEQGTVTNPLAGIVICSCCGRRMTRRPPGKKNPADTLMCAVPECPQISAPLAVVERKLLEAISDWASRYESDPQATILMSGATESEISALTQTASSLRSELSSLVKQRDNLHDLLERGIYTADTFLERSRIISDRLSQAQADLTKAESDLKTAQRRQASLATLIPTVRSLNDVYHTLPDAKSKNNLLKSVLEKVIYTKTVRTPRGGDPDNFTLTLYPRIPD